MADSISSFPQPDPAVASAVLAVWRSEGSSAARSLLSDLLGNTPSLALLPLVMELSMRLAGEPGPRLIVDGVWFSRPYGGVTRVWEQILACWQLPGLLTPNAPVQLIDRDSHLALTSRFPCFEGRSVNPLDADDLLSLAEDNAHFSNTWGAQVFLSSWVSSSGRTTSVCPELALVHDCLPERYGVPEPLKRVRLRWLQGARTHLAVSAATASDIEILLHKKPGSIPWCHCAPSPLFASTLADPASVRLWGELQARFKLFEPFLILPATSSVGSYKNPELLAEALAYPTLHSLQLVLCGIAADQWRQELEMRFPHLQGRCKAAGFTDLELALAYKHALAVIIPSHIEGFGLPAVEALASGATVLVADSRGLREAGGVAAMRFSSRDPHQLAQLLRLLLDPDTTWLHHFLERRRLLRLAPLNPDLLGIAILAEARAILR